MRGVALLLAIAGVAFPFVVGYHVEPAKTQWSGWTSHQAPNNRVSEILTCDFDSLSYVELFAGAKGNGGAYTATVFEGKSQLMTSPGDEVPERGWVRFDNWNTRVAFARAKQYEIRFTRSGGDSIQFYYDRTNPYKYGEMPNDIVSNPADLCMRVYGRMNPVDSTDFGADDVSWWYSLKDETLAFKLARFRDDVLESKVRTVRFDLDWNVVQYDGRDKWHWWLVDSQMRGIRADLGCKPLADLYQTAGWASARVDSVRENGTVFERPVLHCAPRGLNSAINSDSNYLARFIDSVVRHYDDLQMPIHDWEIWNEPNDTTLDPPPGITGWWRRPNRYYDSLGPGLRGLCSLYMRMAKAVDTVVKSHPGHETDKVAIGSMHKVFEDGGGSGLVMGKQWLDTCYAVARQTGMFWDAVSVHPYPLDNGGYYLPFEPEQFEDNAESLRCIMHAHGDSGELWNTEYSRPELSWWGEHPGDTVTTEDHSADYCCEILTMGEGMKGRPGGGFDRNYWWFVKQPLGNRGAWGLMSDSALTRHAEFYAFKQTAELLTGKRFNRRVKDGDTAADNHVRMYEFEDVSGRRTWVCWKDDDKQRGVGVKVPVRTSNLTAESLAYSRTPPAFSPRVSDDGWLRLTLKTRPVFIGENAAPMRPDVRVDSVRYARASRVVRAWVTNHGTRATPVRSGSLVPYLTWAVLRANGDSLAQQVRTASMAVDQQAEFTFDLGQAKLPDTVLFSVTVNPSQTYVELGTDDNTGYALAVRP